MLKIKDITIKNFMSVGAQTQAVNFNTGQLTLVIGENLDMGGNGSRNGTGKSTIFNALSYALYGDALVNIKKDNLINHTNGKNMLVTVEFDIGADSYRIERGRKPNVLRLFINDVEKQHDDDQAQGDSRETQKHIEQIVGFPHEMFKHIVALNTYTEPFLSMRTGDQRAMIEQLLGITDLSAKADVLRELIKATKDAIREEEIRIQTLESNNQNIQQTINELSVRSRAWQTSFDQKIADMEQALVVMNQVDVDQEIAAHNNNAQVKELNDNLVVLRKELSACTASMARSKERLDELQSHLVDAQNGKCHACGQDTAHLETHLEYTQDLQQKINSETQYHNEKAAQVKELEDAINSIDVPAVAETFYSTVAEAYEHKHNMENLMDQLTEKLTETNPYVDQIHTLTETGLQEINFDHMNSLSDLREHQEFLFKLLTSKDSFIRKRIIDQNISYLNHRLTYYLDQIGLPHEVKFSNDLNVEITEYGRELDFDNLSRGERNRLILSLSWAFRDIYESLNQPMNLLCVDELVDSGMDSVGVDAALAILKKMNRDQNKNVFLISHKEELVSRVNSVLTVTKEGGFTSFSTDADFVS